jgi:ubiquinone/menaquinone biosynthesis C-methylase UbiE
VKTETPEEHLQKKFDFTAPKARPFMANLPSRIEVYEEGVADFFRWRTGLDYYVTLDRIIDFVVETGGKRVLDLLTDTAVFALNLAERKAFEGRIYSFDTNITLLERAKQRAAQLKLEDVIEFKAFREVQIPVAGGFGDVAVSIFDFHRHAAGPYLAEVMRVLAPNGNFILAEMVESRNPRNRWVSMWKRLQLRYIKKNEAEAAAVYYDQEEIISLLFKAGFRQVIVQGLNEPSSAVPGTFCLITAIK